LTELQVLFDVRLESIAITDGVHMQRSDLHVELRRALLPSMIPT